ncbi:MAG: cytochrome c biogenesis protein CcsA, partial [Candidatus Hydrothermarchaeaceae archaeon]
LLVIDYGLLTYYFAKSNLTINYVWEFTSKGLPIYYKLVGPLAGQPGTLLFWAALIGIGALWFSERKRASPDFIKKTLIVVLFLGLYLVFLTQIDSPFKTIYTLYPDLRAANNPELVQDFVPEDGNGLNPLLIDPWMAIHPALMFIAYAATTNPFAVSAVYLFQTIKTRKESGLRELLPHVILWCRIAWLFLTLAIAVGGIWAYKVLGWGGFWAWDPVETASLIPWLMLTGAMHTLAEHRKDKKKYILLAPVLVTMTFALVVYATLITRSGFFESVHSFAAGGVGFYLVALTIFAFLLPIALALISYLTVKGTPVEDKEKTFISKTNIFYLAILIFIILTFISVWGVTYPALVKLFTGNKYGVGMSFFNIWSYPLFIGLLLLSGLYFNYKANARVKSLKYFAGFAVLTLVTAVYRPSDAWNIVDYSAIISLEKPFFYTLVGSISALSIFPPSIYLIYSLVERGKERFTRLKNRNSKIVEWSILILHASIVMIFIGMVFSTMFDAEFSAAASIGDKGKISRVEGTPYSIKLIDYGIVHKFEDEDKSIERPPPPGMSLSEFYNDLTTQVRESYVIRGEVAETIQTEHITYLKFVEGEWELWIASDRLNATIPPGTKLVARGSLINLPTESLNRTYLILLADELGSYEGGVQRQVFSTTQQVQVAVYKGTSKIGEGTARVIQYKNGDAKKVMIDRSLTGDVYVIFTGFSGGSIPLDIKIKPLVNMIWLGV